MNKRNLFISFVDNWFVTKLPDPDTAVFIKPELIPAFPGLLFLFCVNGSGNCFPLFDSNCFSLCIRLMDYEYKIVMNWLLEAPELFVEIVNIICTQRVPKEVDPLFLYTLKENKLGEMYPHEVIRLLTLLLNGGTEFPYSSDNIPEIYKAVPGLEEEEKRAFQEACLKRNINLY